MRRTPDASPGDDSACKPNIRSVACAGRNIPAYRGPTGVAPHLSRLGHGHACPDDSADRCALTDLDA